MKKLVVRMEALKGVIRETCNECDVRKECESPYTINAIGCFVADELELETGFDNVNLY